MSNVVTSTIGQRVLIGMSYVIVFAVGLYLSNGSRSIFISPRTNEIMTCNCICPGIVNNSTESANRRSSFFQLGIQYLADKVTTHHYETMYEKHLQKYIGSSISLLEIGLGCGMQDGPGASAYLWRNYLGPNVRIHFIEYDQTCGEKWFNAHGSIVNVTMHYGSQENITFLNSINNTDGYFDIIIDDGGHSMTQQITSFTHLLPKVRSGGLYVIEDIYTSYMSEFGGGYHLGNTTIELIKTLVDDIQELSPQKTIELAGKLFSFELSNKICVFSLI